MTQAPGPANANQACGRPRQHDPGPGHMVTLGAKSGSYFLTANEAGNR